MAQALKEYLPSKTEVLSSNSSTTKKQNKQTKKDSQCDVGWRYAQIVEHLFSKCEALSLNPSATKKKKKEEWTICSLYHTRISPMVLLLRGESADSEGYCECLVFNVQRSVI
jgi:hypothetical protein